MGSPGAEAGRFIHEGPQRVVSFAEPFYMGKFEVTQDQWYAVMSTNPSKFKGANMPIDSVRWADAQEFCRKLSALTGQKVRLPTEAEWEYACRAGTQTRYGYGDDPLFEQLDQYAWYVRNSNRQSQPVGQKKPNAWGLYDMHGNVWEWCEDLYVGSYADAPTDGSAVTERSRGAQLGYASRGGSYLDNGNACRSAARNGLGRRQESQGLRVVVVPE